MRRVGRSLGPPGDEADSVADADTHLGSPSGHLPRADARALEVDQHLAAAPALSGRTSRVAGHRGPLLSTVVRAVDPHDVGAALDKVAHEAVLLGRIGRQGDHDPHLPAGGLWTEDRLRVPAKEAVATIEDGGTGMAHPGQTRFRSGDRGEGRDDSIEIRKHPRLAATE